MSDSLPTRTTLRGPLIAVLIACALALFVHYPVLSSITCFRSTGAMLFYVTPTTTGPIAWGSMKGDSWPIQIVYSAAVDPTFSGPGAPMGTKYSAPWSFVHREPATQFGERVFETAIGLPFPMTIHTRRFVPAVPNVVPMTIALPSFTGLPGPATEPTRWIWWGIVGNLIVWGALGFAVGRWLSR
ncbi:MAG: hypothetical protein SFY95_11160 [Planctomycetota bacterium]|nr:hypothetical protein [Planctomycetota bacterium]